MCSTRCKAQPMLKFHTVYYMQYPVAPTLSSIILDGRYFFTYIRSCLYTMKGAKLASSTLTLDSHISCGCHCWWRCVSCWLAGVLSSMGCVQRVEWEGEDGGWASGSLSPHCDVTTIGHCSAITGEQPLNSWLYIRLNSTGQGEGLPRYWLTRVHGGNVVV